VWVTRTMQCLFLQGVYHRTTVPLRSTEVGTAAIYSVCRGSPSCKKYSANIVIAVVLVAETSPPQTYSYFLKPAPKPADPSSRFSCISNINQLGGRGRGPSPQFRGSGSPCLQQDSGEYMLQLVTHSVTSPLPVLPRYLNTSKPELRVFS
jgi:hypothetical protein